MKTTKPVIFKSIINGIVRHFAVWEDGRPIWVKLEGRKWECLYQHARWNVNNYIREFKTDRRLTPRQADALLKISPLPGTKPAKPKNSDTKRLNHWLKNRGLMFKTRDQIDADMKARK